MAKSLPNFQFVMSAKLPLQAKLSQIVWLFLIAVTLTLPVLTISAPGVQALSKQPTKRYCKCGCQYKKNGKWVDGNSVIGFSKPFATKCETSDGNAHTCRTAPGGRNVPGRLSNCSIDGLSAEAGGVPEDGGTVEPGTKNPGAVLPPVLPDAATE